MIVEATAKGPKRVEARTKGARIVGGRRLVVRIAITSTLSMKMVQAMMVETRRAAAPISRKLDWTKTKTGVIRKRKVTRGVYLKRLKHSQSMKEAACKI